jgi:SAM-dependent methyltransferase
VSWTWDATLYEGSAAFYARGRMPYPHVLADALRDELALDGTGRLLDVGCGPGSLTMVLAPLFAEAIGIDADPAMVAEASTRAPANATFRQLRAEALPADLGTFDAVTFGQSFHWVDQFRVAATVHAMLRPGGAFVTVGATTHEGDGNVPREAIKELIRRYLGPGRRAGQSTVSDQGPPWNAPEALDAAGFGPPVEIPVPAGQTYERTEDDIVASVFSQSSSAPHLFGGRLEAFERDVRSLLREHAPTDGYRERVRDMTLLLRRRDYGSEIRSSGSESASIASSAASSASSGTSTVSGSSSPAAPISESMPALCRSSRSCSASDASPATAT